jgi:hypothetical protein
MATSIHVNSTDGDDTRRLRLYSGDLYVFTPRPAMLAVVEFAKELLAEAFAPYDPLTVQYEMPVEDFVARFAPVKPKFIHHPRTKELMSAALEELGCDLDDIYVDVPRLRGVTSDGYLTAGVGFAHHPHRDTWYSAPMAQLNWWVALYPFASESSMDFHLRYFDAPVKNGSADFNYYEWNTVGRAEAAKHIKTDTRKQPKAEEVVDPEPAIRLTFEPGTVLVFSPQHLHSTVPNTTGLTRFSFDLRTVSRSDLEAGLSARNVDSKCTGTSLRDFLRGTDRSALPDELVARYDIADERFESAGLTKVFAPGG